MDVKTIFFDFNGVVIDSEPVPEPDPYLRALEILSASTATTFTCDTLVEAGTDEIVKSYDELIFKLGF